MTNQSDCLHGVTTTAGRAGNASLLIAGMIMLFFITSVILITGPAAWQYQTGSFILYSSVWYGIAGALIFFWWRTRPEEEV